MAQPASLPSDFGRMDYIDCFEDYFDEKVT